MKYNKIMNVTFLGQGFDPSSQQGAIGNHLKTYFAQANFHTATCISAFVSAAAVKGLSQEIIPAKSHFQSINIIVGIDQEGTSKEALEELLNLNVNSYIFFQSEPPIFHPKIYLFEGDQETKIIIGSSNLTARGLFTNVESSLLIEYSNADVDGVSLLNSIKLYYATLFNFTDPNLFKIDQQVIDDFTTMGIVPLEQNRRTLYNRKTTNNNTSNAATSTSVPKRIVSQIPVNFIQRTAQVATSVSVQNTSPIVTTTPSGFSPNIVWQSGPLTERDLNIPHGSNTNPTGSMLFKKGLTSGIDQRVYFRNQVFQNLIWAFDGRPNKTHIERTTANFELIVLGVNQGTFPLIISHNSDQTSKSYLQNNSMTSLSWGKAKSIVANRNLIGKSMNLMDNPQDPSHFILEIV